MRCVWLALLPIIAAQSELCPEVTTSKPCSASQDFVFVVDASFSRLDRVPRGVSGVSPPFCRWAGSG